MSDKLTQQWAHLQNQGCTLHTLSTQDQSVLVLISGDRVYKVTKRVPTTFDPVLYAGSIINQAYQDMINDE